MVAFPPSSSRIVKLEVLMNGAVRSTIKLRVLLLLDIPKLSKTFADSETAPEPRLISAGKNILPPFSVQVPAAPKIATRPTPPSCEELNSNLLMPEHWLDPHVAHAVSMAV